MDPDLVRQQQEAEREAMQLAGRKQATPPPLTAAAFPGAEERTAPHSQPQPGRYAARSALWYFGQFLAFGLAGAMLGGGLGIAAANYMRLPVEAAKLAILGPAGIFAIACAFASFFTGKPAQPRASSGT